VGTGAGVPGLNGSGKTLCRHSLLLGAGQVEVGGSIMGLAGGGSALQSLILDLVRRPCEDGSVRPVHLSWISV
jgi:hypothetical protein